MDVRRFKADLYELAGRACRGEDESVRSKVFGIANMLVGLYRKNQVKINHSALELVCAKGLVKEGYEVKVEHRLDRTLVCDVIGSRGDGPLIVEIETGFIPPEAALEPSLYARSRIASKIARYSRFSGKFALGTTPSYVLDFSQFFVKPPRLRTRKEAVEIKALTDEYYDDPPILEEDLMRAHLNSVYVIDVDAAQTTEVDPRGYSEMREVLAKLNHGHQTLNRNEPKRGGGFNIGEASARGIAG
ncbi:MAG: hypothetical protein HY296_05245 [Thaumarchaeota archaeon]|nr:hypothetical protein [Nitrososphaerota archaeon]